MGKIWSKGDTHPPQMGLQTDTVSKKISVVIPIEAGKRSSQDPASPLWCIYQKELIFY